MDPSTELVVSRRIEAASALRCIYRENSGPAREGCHKVLDSFDIIGVAQSQRGRRSQLTAPYASVGRRL